MSYVRVSPLTRLEGHLGITASVRNGEVVTAWSHGEMFRGLEKILRDRDPRDAPVITSRTCGVCHFIHRHTSLRNIENAAGFSFPAPQASDLLSDNTLDDGEEPGMTNATTYRIESDRDWVDGQTANGSLGGNPIPVAAQLARNIVHALTFIYSHAAHLIVLAGPDYWDEIEALGISGIDKEFCKQVYYEAIVAQRILHEILGLLGGKVPHQMSAVPGGFSQTINQTVLDTVAELAQKRVPKGGDSDNLDSDFWPLLDYDYLGLDKQIGLTDSSDASWVARRAVPFLLLMVKAAVEKAGAHEWGKGSGNFVCAPTFDIVQPVKIIGDAYFRGGARIGAYGWVNGGNGDLGTLKILDPTSANTSNSDAVTIYEDVTSGKYPDEEDPDDPHGITKYGGYPGDAKIDPYVIPDPKRTEYKFYEGIGDKYTWYKATRVKDSNDNLYVVESGPLARLVVNDVDPLGLREYGVGQGYSAAPHTNNISYPVDLAGEPTRNTATISYSVPAAGKYESSTVNRLTARAQDILLLIDMLIGTNYSEENNSGDLYYLEEIYNNCWLTRLQDALNALGNPNKDKALPSTVMYSDPPNPWDSLGDVGSPAKGCGYWDAPRGITCHFSQVVNGRLIQYQHIAGTTWNGNGRDKWGQPGPFEWSLMNFQMVADLDTENVGETSNTIADARKGTNWNKSRPSPHDVKITLSNTPIAENSVKIEFEVYGDKFYAEDIPKCDGSTEGYMWAHPPGGERGQAWIKDKSYIDYEKGEVYLYFKDPPELPDREMENVYDTVVVRRYGYIKDAVPAPEFSSGPNTGKPNPHNILRTIRSYDPCLACSVHAANRKGVVGKYEVVPVAGWEVNEK